MMDQRNRPHRKVLLVEDCAVNRKLLAYMLKNEGYEVVHAFDGKEAVTKFQQQPFHLVIMDIQMPVMDGLEATRLIRECEMESSGHTPIVAVTSGVDRGRCIDAGMDDYIEKPVRVPIFHEVLERLDCCSS